MVIRLILIDDQPLIREGLRFRLEATGRFSVVGETNDTNEALQLAKTLAPQLAVIDIGSCRTRGTQLTRSLLMAQPSLAVLIFTMIDNDESITAAIRAGARGYVLKNAQTHEIVTAIEMVAAGGTYYSDAAVKALTRIGTQPPLSQREREVLAYVAEGYSNKETARRLNLSVRTVETHRETIRRKLGAENTLDLVRQAVQMGLINF